LKDLTPATLVPAARPRIGRSPDLAAPERLISLGPPSDNPDRVEARPPGADIRVVQSSAGPAARLPLNALSDATSAYGR